MTAFKNITIRTKLLGGFGVVAMLGGIIALTALFTISIFIGDIDDLIGRRIPQVKGIASINEAIYNSSLHIDEAMLASDMDSTLKELEITDQNRTATNENMDNLKKSIKSEKGNVLYQAIVDTRRPYVDVRDRLITLIKEGRKNEALQEHKFLKPLRDAYIGALKDMDAWVQEQSIIQGDHTRSNARTERMVIIALALISTAIS